MKPNKVQKCRYAKDGNYSEPGKKRTYQKLAYSRETFTYTWLKNKKKFILGNSMELCGIKTLPGK